MMYQTLRVITKCPPDVDQRAMEDIERENANTLDTLFCSGGDSKLYKNKSIADCHGVNAIPLQPSLNCTKMTLEKQPKHSTNDEKIRWLIKECTVVYHDIDNQCKNVELVNGCNPEVLGDDLCRIMIPKNAYERMIKSLCLSHVNLF